MSTSPGPFMSHTATTKDKPNIVQPDISPRKQSVKRNSSGLASLSRQDRPNINNHASRISQRRSPISYGTCTHITMDILYDFNILCDLCHRSSRFGFLYKCNQDVYVDTCAKKYLREFPDSEAIKTSTVAQLRAINMSASVISQFEQGDVYTQDQLETLKIQKSHMLTIADQHKARLPLIPECNLKCCPACRPYLKDRVPYSFGAVFAGEVEPIEPEKEQLPIKPAHKMLQLGLRPLPRIPPHFPFGSGSAETSDDNDDISISSDEDDDSDSDGVVIKQERGDRKEVSYTRESDGREQEKRAKTATDIDGSDGAAVTEESVETATVVPDIVQV